VRAGAGLAEVDRYASPGTAKLLVGNKSDRADKVVSTETGETHAANLDIPFLETSAKTSENVEAGGLVLRRRSLTPVCVRVAFLAMTAQLLKQKGGPATSPQQRDRKRVALNQQQTQSAEGGCCG
jgi:hypothetical protein